MLTWMRHAGQLKECHRQRVQQAAGEVSLRCQRGIACRQRSDHVDVGLESGSRADSSTRSNQRLRDLVCLAECSVSHLTSSQLSHCALLQSCRLRSHASHLAERHACQSLPQRSPSLRFLCCPVCPTVALHALQASGSPHLLYCHSSLFPYP